ncbi:ATP-binding protein [Streptomyces albidoflavus]|uniref:ATP-binding protein n=1 Tax=Streptomyces albidoflavus TaxID=1886 RepID=UPI003092FFE3|nr:ATP-binding protein [Streptomyces sp. MT29]WSD44168.1 ATP-binding protein [Streptomyces albidoflavus]
MLPKRYEKPCCQQPAGPPPQLMLMGEEQSAKAARDYAREFVEFHLPDADPGHTDDVALVVSELVTNSIRYGTKPGDSLLVVLDATEQRTRVEVHDTARREPKRKPESDERGRGRGLFIVDALGTWGTGERPMGKYVWAEVRGQ